MATTENSYTKSNSNGPSFTFTFPYITTSDVKVYVDDTLKTEDTHYEFDTATSIRFLTGHIPATGEVIKISRITSLDNGPQNRFYTGSFISAESINSNFEQVIFRQQEIDNDAGATAAQGLLADSAIQPLDNVSELTNDAGYITAADIPADAVSSVNTQTGAVVLDADDIDDTSTTHKFATAAQLSAADSAVQPGDLATVATTGAYGDLSGTPTLGTAASTASTDYATAAQGTKADSALQSTDIGVSVQGYDADTVIDANYVATDENFTTADHSKLDGIEAGATADQTDAEIKTAYENNLDTNAFTDAEQTKLAGIAAGAEVNVNADWNAISGDAQILNKPTLGTAAATASTDYATAAQGTTADSAVQPGDLATVATSGSYNDLTNKPTIPAAAPVDSVNSQTGAVVLDADDIDDTSTLHKFATAAQLSAADSAVQPGDLATVATSGSYNDLSNKPTIPAAAPVDSVNTQTGAVVLDADDIDDTSTTNKFTTAADISKLAGIAAGAEVNVQSDWNAISGDALILNKPTLGTAAATDSSDYATAAQGTLADSAVQPGDNVSGLTNDANYIDSAGAPVQSVNTQTGVVVLDADDIDDTSTLHKFATAAQLSAATSAVQPGDLSTVATSGAYSDLSGTPTIPTNNNQLTNGAGYITASSVPTNNNQLTNGAGYITGYTVTSSDVTQHQSAITITESQISDLGSYATQSYVNTQVSNLVDTAPGTLDTLNELAAALGDDANFSTTISNSIGTKMPLAGGTFTGAVTFASGQTFDYGSLTNTPTIPSNNNQLTNGAGYITAADIPADTITSVNTQTGAVVLDTDDISEGTTNLYSQWGSNGTSTYYNDGNVGVGTNNPGAKLDVAGTIKSSLYTSFGGFADLTPLKFERGAVGSGMEIQLSSSAYSLVATDKALRFNSDSASGAIQFRVDDDEKVLIDSDGYVGIGDTNPVAPLTVKDNSNTTGRIIQRWIADTGANVRNANLLAPEADDIDSPFTFYTDNSWNFRVDTTDALTIDTIGKVGIGVTAPTQKLDLTDSSGARIAFTNSGSRRWSVGNNGTSLTIRDESGSADRMTITDSGNVGIGTIDPAQLLELSSSAPRLRITDNNSTAGAGSTSYLEFHGSDARSAVIYTSTSGLNIQADAAGGNALNFLTNGNNTRLTIDNSGNTGIATESPNERFSVDVSGTTNRAIEIYNGDTTLSSGQLVHAIRFTQNDSSAPNTTHASIETVTSGSTGLLNMVFKARDNQEFVRIDTSGRVGVGTDSPTQKLELEGDTGARIAFTDTGTRRYSIGNDSSSLTIRDESGSADRLTINSSGKISTNGPLVIGTDPLSTSSIKFRADAIRTGIIYFDTYGKQLTASGSSSQNLTYGGIRISDPRNHGGTIHWDELSGSDDQAKMAAFASEANSSGGRSDLFIPAGVEIRLDEQITFTNKIGITGPSGAKGGGRPKIIFINQSGWHTTNNIGFKCESGIRAVYVAFEGAGKAINDHNFASGSPTAQNIEDASPKRLIAIGLDGVKGADGSIKNCKLGRLRGSDKIFIDYNGQNANIGNNSFSDLADGATSVRLRFNKMGSGNASEWRKCRVYNNQFHTQAGTESIVVTSTEEDADGNDVNGHASQGLQITDNIVDIGARLLKIESSVNGLVVSGNSWYDNNNSDQSNSAAISVTDGTMKGCVITGNTFSGYENGSSSTKPDTFIRIASSVTVRGLCITGCAFSFCNSTAVHVGNSSSANAVTITGSSFRDVGSTAFTSGIVNVGNVTG